MDKFRDVDFDNLDEYEQELEDALTEGSFKSVKNVKSRLKEAQKIAANTLRKNKKITIRVSGFDIDALKRKAANEGIPYQTLITSILHKYVTGQPINQ